MLWLMYLLMSLLTLAVHYTFNKNKYFDKLHKREKVMKVILQEINDTYYPLRDVVWMPGKYGLFFYGQLKRRKSSFYLSQLCSEASL